MQNQERWWECNLLKICASVTTREGARDAPLHYSVYQCPLPLAGCACTVVVVVGVGGRRGAIDYLAIQAKFNICNLKIGLVSVIYDNLVMHADGNKLRELVEAKNAGVPPHSTQFGLALSKWCLWASVASALQEQIYTQWSLAHLVAFLFCVHWLSCWFVPRSEKLESRCGKSSQRT